MSNSGYMLIRLICPWVLVLCVGAAFAQSSIRVSRVAWGGLSLAEQESIQKRNLVELLEPGSFGVVIDNQGQDNSTQGSTGGTGLGMAIGSAAYIDNAFRPAGNYSAKTHLAATLLGGILGSAFNQAPQRSFQFRYAVRFLDGNVGYFDSMSVDSFRHSVGVCVSVPGIQLMADQTICSQTADTLRQRYLPGSNLPGNTLPALAMQQATSDVSSSPVSPAPAVQDSILCKVENIAPVNTTLEKCKSINGEVIR